MHGYTMSAGSLASSPGGCGAGLYCGLQSFGTPGYTTGVGDLMAVTTPEVVEDADERWFEVSFISPVQLAGNARDGWLDPTLKVAFHLERSEDLASWSHGEWLDRPSTPVPGGWEYRGRSPYPVNSYQRTAQLLCDATRRKPDVRNGPITGITLAGVAQNLPHFPYALPADAAQLQTDLRAVGWTGATVTAASYSDFQIAIPDVPIAAWDTVNRVFWPVWLTGYGAFGEALYSEGLDFAGEFVNSAGVRTSVPRQFARLAVTTNPSPSPA